MYVGKDFDPSDVGEDEVYSLNFASSLALGETIATSDWRCLPVVNGKVDSDGDPEAQSHVIGAATIAGTKSCQRISGLRAGVRYRLIATIGTSQGNVRKRWSHVIAGDPQ